MALLINCPNCSNQIVNNGEDCPFCGYSMKTGKTREQMEQEAAEAEQAEAAKAAEEAAKAEAEARAAEEAARAEAEARAAEEAARAEAEARAAEEAARAAAQAKAAEEAARAAAQANQTSNIYSKFRQKAVPNQPNAGVNAHLNNHISEQGNLPEFPQPGGKNLPPIEIERPVPISKIANTPAVPLTPIAKEKVDNTLPPMQVEREISVEQIKNTAAVPLGSIQREQIDNALPGMNTPKNQPQIEVSAPNQQPVRPPVQPPVQQPVQPPVQPPVQQPVQPPVQPPVQQPVNPQQRPPRQQKQWSSNPQDFSENNGQQPANPQQRPPRQQKQWSSNPQDFSENNGQQSANPQQRPPRQPRQPRPNGQRRPQNSGRTELNPIIQEQRDTTPTGERLENLPPQQTSNDPNFDTDSYVRNLHRQIKQDQASTNQQQGYEDVVKKAENIEVKPMAFDGKQLRGANVNVVKAPSKGGNMILPIVIVIILIIALIVIAVVMLSGGSDESASGTDTSGASTASSLASAGMNVTFEKPSDWGDEVYAYVYKPKANGDDADKIAIWPGEKMRADGNSKYSYTVSGSYTDGGFIIFNDNKGEHQYPDKNEEGLAIKAGETYKVK